MPVLIYYALFTAYLFTVNAIYNHPFKCTRADVGRLILGKRPVQYSMQALRILRQDRRATGTFESPSIEDARREVPGGHGRIPMYQ